ncbi:MAG TPA: helix-turn-helix domain-containing protein [Calditrichia bacterium]|nr:helix-turn-helix domain-containing protein [Calditrichota bacterium]HQU71384.1 helix-turn-helix domain-containing protein [Calditrichia bacterium]HQV30864.1 helix-turn-helix domain-containing protein [Calditrichia bacterium]
MKHVSILVPNGNVSMVNLEGTHQILEWVNSFLRQNGRDPLFELHRVGLANSTQPREHLSLRPDTLIGDVKHTDLIILPAIHGDHDYNMSINPGLCEWLVRQYHNGAEIASMCIGAFVLGSAGLLDGKPCSTHWSSANQFRALFPNALLMDEKIMTAADGIYTSGGAYAFTNLLVYLIEKYAGREVAIMAAKAFMVDIDRHTQSPFIMFTAQKGHNDRAVLNAQNYIEEHFEEKISVSDLCRRLGVGRRTFERRFKKATSNTVMEYIQRVRIEAAKKALESGRKTVNEVMFDVGYSDAKAFREVFKKMAGMSPVDYRSKYNRSAAVA